MPIIRNNNFIRDSFGTRIERLITIQGNFGLVQPELLAPAHIVAWTANCMDAFSNILAESGVDRNETEAATVNSEMKYASMASEYQNLRLLGMTIYHDQPVFLKDFGFDTAFPQTRNNRIARVELVLDTNARQIEEGVTPLLPAEFIARLEAAKVDYLAALLNQEKKNSVARHSKSELDEHFAADTRILQELRAWWFVKMGKNHDGVELIGMVNPKKSGVKRKRRKVIEENEAAPIPEKG